MTPRKSTKVDIHNWQGNLERALQKLKEEEKLSKRNKDLILKYDEESQIKEGVGIPRRVKVLAVLRLIAVRYVKKDYDKLTKRDLEKALVRMESIDKATTKADYKVVLKKFLKWVEWGDKAFRDRKNCPEWLQIIRTTVSRKEKEETKLRKNDLLTPEEVLSLITAAEHPRDKALISLVYELGARVSEIGNLRLKDISKEEHGFHIDISGKTGRRAPIAVISAPYLTNWLNVHPYSTDPNAPLWVQRNSHGHNLPNDRSERTDPDNAYVLKPMGYASIAKIIKKTVKKAKINKRVYPHLFRHSRVTHLLAEGTLTEAQAKRFFGWTPSSKVLGEVYSHLTDQDANDAILSKLGLKQKEDETDKLKPRKCVQCQTVNPAEFRFCGKCGGFLDTASALEYQEKKKELDNELYSTIENMLSDPDGRKHFMKHMSKDLVKALVDKSK